MRGSVGWALGCLAMLAACSTEYASSNEFADGVDTGESLNLSPARGIGIAEVEVNQGTRVVVGQASDWIAVEQRPIGLIAERDALVRVHYEVDPGWIARDIEARLTLEWPDGTAEVLSAGKWVDGDSTADSLEGGFWFALSADAGQTAAGIEYRVELWDLRETVEELPELAWANPREGSEAIGFEAIPLEMKVVLVPIHYVPLDTTPKLDDADLTLLIDNLYEQNPTNAVLWDVRDAVDYEGQLDDLAELLPMLSQLAVADEADPNTYYHALIDVGAPTIAGLRGIGNIVGDGEAEGSMRVAATVYWAGDPSLAAETFTHEIGHNQGLEHVSCPNVEADGLAAGYPHPNGWIGNWGAGTRRLEVFGPEQAFDYMSYCAPSWVSDWTWNRTRERIATLTSWDHEAEREPSERWLLIGAEQADGTMQWWTAPGELDRDRLADDVSIGFVDEEGRVVEQPAQVVRLSEGWTTWIRAELPTDFDRIAAIHHRRGERVVEVPLDAVVTELDVEPFTPRLRTRADHSTH